MLLFTLTSAAFFAAAPVAQVVTPASVPVAVERSVQAAANPHLQNARSAMEKGDLSLARREYQFAQIVDREAGRIPVDASKGLAALLFTQSQPRAAAEIMQQLADEAALAGQIDLEASALVSATWLRLECGDRFAVKEGVRRLHQISRDRSISSETRAMLKKQLG